MPLPKGARYRVKHTSKGPIRLAFVGKKVVEAKKLRSGKKGGMKDRLAHMIGNGDFKKRGRRKR